MCRAGAKSVSEGAKDQLKQRNIKLVGVGLEWLVCYQGMSVYNRVWKSSLVETILLVRCCHCNTNNTVVMLHRW